MPGHLAGAAAPRISVETLGQSQSAHAVRKFDGGAHTDWTSLLVRRFEHASVMEHTTLSPVPDQLIHLQVRGSMAVESTEGGRWRRAHHVPGSIAMTEPGKPSTLRWRATGPEPIETIQVHLPGQSLADAAEHLWDGRGTGVRLPDALLCRDPTVEAVVRALARAAEARASALYADSAQAFLCMHLLEHHTGRNAVKALGRDEARVRKAEQFMHDNLSDAIRLADIAAAVHLSPYHFLRLFREATGETPRRYLERLRLRKATARLERERTSIADIAIACGFGSAQHFAALFRRENGISPSEFRRDLRR
ncbi:helix-turn-helix domain-containing protein [Amycolatopsis sp. NPDC088138]|uniref:AraC family transcriptional regulator n=1 Tax=Amycolatopsis sp. NPDC088138 TaxID=3363938 RepID=UPI0038142290